MVGVTSLAFENGLCQDHCPPALCSQAGLLRTPLLPPAPGLPGRALDAAFQQLGRGPGRVRCPPQSLSLTPHLTFGRRSPPMGVSHRKKPQAGPGALRATPGPVSIGSAERGQSSPAQVVGRGPGCDRKASWAGLGSHFCSVAVLDAPCTAGGLRRRNPISSLRKLPEKCVCRGHSPGGGKPEAREEVCRPPLHCTQGPLPCPQRPFISRALCRPGPGMARSHLSDTLVTEHSFCCNIFPSSD